MVIILCVLGVLCGKHHVFPSTPSAGEGRGCISLDDAFPANPVAPSPAVRWERRPGGEGR